jgi:hypothetical protein
MTITSTDPLRVPGEVQAVSYLGLRPQTTTAALGAIERWLAREEDSGTLKACWHSRLGVGDRILLWRSFENADQFDDAMLRLSTSSDPFGTGEHLDSLGTNAFRTVPFAGPISAAVRGPLFEVRDYTMKPDGLGNLLALWRPLLPARLQLAPWVTAMYALSGKAPRVLHIYPWASLDERARTRDAAQAVGWPPAGAPAQILVQETTIYLAAPFSPVQ